MKYFMFEVLWVELFKNNLCFFVINCNLGEFFKSHLIHEEILIRSV